MKESSAPYDDDERTVKYAPAGVSKECNAVPVLCVQSLPEVAEVKRRDEGQREEAWLHVSSPYKVKGKGRPRFR